MGHAHVNKLRFRWNRALGTRSDVNAAGFSWEQTLRGSRSANEFSAEKEDSICGTFAARFVSRNGHIICAGKLLKCRLVKGV